MASWPGLRVTYCPGLPGLRGVLGCGTFLFFNPESPGNAGTGFLFLNQKLPPLLRCPEPGSAPEPQEGATMILGQGLEGQKRARGRAGLLGF